MSREVERDRPKDLIVIGPKSGSPGLVGFFMMRRPPHEFASTNTNGFLSSIQFSWQMNEWMNDMMAGLVGDGVEFDVAVAVKTKPEPGSVLERENHKTYHYISILSTAGVLPIRVGRVFLTWKRTATRIGYVSAFWRSPRVWSCALRVLK